MTLLTALTGLRTNNLVGLAAPLTLHHHTNLVLQPILVQSPQPMRLRPAKPPAFDYCPAPTMPASDLDPDLRSPRDRASKPEFCLRCCVQQSSPWTLPRYSPGAMA